MVLVYVFVAVTVEEGSVVVCVTTAMPVATCTQACETRHFGQPTIEADVRIALGVNKTRVTASAASRFHCRPVVVTVSVWLVEAITPILAVAVTWPVSVVVI